ncbi:MAG: molybdenum cofactor biosynthesis protein, partial [Planctomycetes bacterium]|nr:molybdenum cofactor biosynthesis protein [Planctomycetota bacterium]
MSVEEHRKNGREAAGSVRCAIVTVSDTRTLETDESGQLIESLLRAAGH